MTIRPDVVRDLMSRDFSVDDADNVAALWAATPEEQAAVVELHYRAAVAADRMAMGLCPGCGRLPHRSTDDDLRAKVADLERRIGRVRSEVAR